MGPALPIIAIVATVAGIGLQTLSEVQAAEQRAQSSEALRQILGQEAASIRDAAAREAEQERRRTARILGKLRATGAAAGIDISTGSALLLELDSAKEAELSRLTILHRGELRAIGRQQEAIFAARRRDIARRSKFGIGLKGGLRAAGSVLTEFAGSGGGGRGIKSLGGHRRPIISGLE